MRDGSNKSTQVQLPWGKQPITVKVFRNVEAHGTESSELAIFSPLEYAHGLITMAPSGLSTLDIGHGHVKKTRRHCWKEQL